MTELTTSVSKLILATLFFSNAYHYVFLFNGKDQKYILLPVFEVIQESNLKKNNNKMKQLWNADPFLNFLCVLMHCIYK